MRFINQQSLKVASVFQEDNFSFIIFSHLVSVKVAT